MQAQSSTVPYRAWNYHLDLRCWCAIYQWSLSLYSVCSVHIVQSQGFIHCILLLRPLACWIISVTIILQWLWLWILHPLRLSVFLTAVLMGWCSVLQSVNMFFFKFNQIKCFIAWFLSGRVVYWQADFFNSVAWEESFVRKTPTKQHTCPSVHMLCEGWMERSQLLISTTSLHWPTTSTRWCCSFMYAFRWNLGSQAVIRQWSIMFLYRQPPILLSVFTKLQTKSDRSFRCEVIIVLKLQV